jgi:Xaa-Pro aminopeptidase
MLSMEPSIKRGLTFWDRALMPRDEFDERIRLVRSAMRERGLHALVIAGNMYEDADLLWLTAGPVDGILVLTLEDEPAIFTNSGSRESFFLRELTFIEELSYRGPLVGSAVRAALAARGVTAGRIGTAGLQVLASAPLQDVRQALADYTVEDASPMLRLLRASLRPRERVAVRIALGIATQAADAASAAFASGASNATAAIEAERIARRAGAWDVRILANLGAPGLRPFERPCHQRRAPLLLWVAARYQGYWADQAVASPDQPESEVSRALKAMMRAARAGVPAGEVAEAGLAALPEASRPIALDYGLGGGIGIELLGAPIIRPGNNAKLTAGALLAFRIFADGATPSFASALVEVSENGVQALAPLARDHWSTQAPAGSADHAVVAGSSTGRGTAG